MKTSAYHKYRVQEIQDVPRSSHFNHLFPECVYSLLRLEDGKSIRVQLRRLTGWKVGDTVEMDDLSLKVASLNR